MPMHFPDLKSVQKLAKDMAAHKGDKKYRGICPKTDKDLFKARWALAKYMLEVWKDRVFAAEIFYAATPKNYDKVMLMSMGIEDVLKAGLTTEECRRERENRKEDGDEG